MTHGIDTDFLVAAEISDHVFHAGADALIRRLLGAGDEFALAPQTLAEFIHIVTDLRRMTTPLTMADAIIRAEHWWNAAEVVRIYPTSRSTSDFLHWLREHRLGRKRLLDTQLASAFRDAGVSKIITNNGADYEVFGCFQIVEYRQET